MAITLTFDQPDAGIPAGSVDRGRTDIKSTGAIAATRAYPVTITVGAIPTGALVDVVLLDEPPGANPLLTELAPETWTLEFDVGCWGPFRVRVTATASGEVVSSVTRRISIRSPGYHIDYPGLAERYDPNATSVPTVPSVEQTEMNEGSTNRPLVSFHRQLVEAIETGGSGGGGVIPDGSITEEKLAPALSDNLLRADGTIPFTGDQDAAGHVIHNVGAPLLPNDAVPLSTVLAAVNRAGTRTPCRLVATTPVTASNTQVIDSQSTVNGDRVLLTAQTAAADNGIYLANDTGAWVRSTDADSSEELLPGMVTFITAGTSNADSGWILSTDAPILLGTSPLTFTRFTGAAQVVAGAGMTKAGNQLDVVAHADGSVVVSADAVQVGTLATDAQHGSRGGGTQHAAATASVAGFISAADKTKLDGVASSAAALTSSAPANVGTTAAVGVGTTAARSDHVHAHAAQTDGTLHSAATASVAGFMAPGDKTKLDGISSGAAALASTAPAAVAFSSSVGIGTTAARSDHVHAHGAQTDGTLHAAASTSVAGFMAPGDKTKLDGVSSGAAALTATAPTQITVTTAAVGVETAAAKGDHVHSVSTGAPSALAVGGAQSTGSTTSLARSDHQHAMPPVATTGADGFMSAADKTRLDGMATAAAALTSTAPVAVDSGVAAVGVGTTAARHDHKHTVTINTPVALTVGGANVQGSLASLARSDHQHAMPGVVTTSVDGFASAADKTKLDGVEAGAQVTSFARVQTALAAASSSVSFNAQKLTNVADPTAAQEAATKAYVDAIAQGLDIKASCRVVASTNLGTLSGNYVIDGVTTVNGDRVLLTAQTTASQNGIWVTASGAWARASDADTSAEVTSGLYTYITEGTANADSGWALTTNDPIILGTTALVFTQVSGAGQITAGAGLTKSGNTLDVVAHADGSIVVAADSVQVGIISDAQHGNRGRGLLHQDANSSQSGFMSATDKTKLDGVATGAAALSSTLPAIVDTAAGDAGTGITGSRIDHRHQVRAGSPVALTVPGTAADGTSSSLARADHKHAMPSAGTPVALTLAGANAPGSAATLALSDHVHALPASSTTPTAIAVGGAGTAGSSTSISKADHVHPLASFGSAAGTFCEGNDVRLGGVSYKDAVQWVAIANFGLAGLVTGAAVGDRVLCVAQTVPAQNGIYVVAGGAWSRAPDADTSAKVSLGLTVVVLKGRHGVPEDIGVNGRWTLTAATATPIVLGTTGLTFTQHREPLRPVVTATPNAGEVTFITTESAIGNVTPPSTGLVLPGSMFGIVIYTEGGAVAPRTDGSKLIGPDGQTYVYPAVCPLSAGSYEWRLYYRATGAEYIWHPVSVFGALYPADIESVDFTIDAIQHGAQTDGTLHAAASTTVAGFLSAADKVKLNSLDQASVVPWIVEPNTGSTLLYVDEFLPGSNPDLAARGYTCTNVSTGATMTRLGNVTWGTISLTATQYNSTIVGSWLFIQTGAQMSVTRAMSAPFGCIAMRGVPSNPLAATSQRLGLLVADSATYSTSKKLFAGFVNGVSSAQLLGASSQTGTGAITVGTGSAPTASNTDTDIFVASKQTATNDWGISLRKADPPVVIAEYWSVSPAVADTATVFGFIVDSGNTGAGQRHCAIDYIRRYPANTFFGY